MISIQESGSADRVQKTGLLCGEKAGLESKNKLTTIKQRRTSLFSVLLPVPRGSKVFFDFDLETDEANWRLKISKEKSPENIHTTKIGMIKCCYRHELNIPFLQRVKTAVAVEKKAGGM